LLPQESKFNEIINKACQKDRDERFQSCQEFLNNFPKSLDEFNDIQIDYKTIFKSSVETDEIGSNEKTIIEFSTNNALKFTNEEGFNESIKDSSVTANTISALLLNLIQFHSQNSVKHS
jgi:hypothetical protein